MITSRALLPPDFTSVCFVFASFLSRAKSTTKKPRGTIAKEEDAQHFWRREKHKNNDSFKLALDDVVVGHLEQIWGKRN
jgi:hypothetical protein